MALTAKHKDTEFGVGDQVRVVQIIKEGDKTRKHAFEGMVIKIKGREENKSFTVRRIGVAQIGIEKIYPLESPTIEEIEVVRQGTRGVKRAKLYYIRDKPRREIEKIYSRAKKRKERKKGRREGTKSKSAKSAKSAARQTSQSRST